MSQKSVVSLTKAAAEQVMRDIRRAARKHHSAEDKIRIVLEGLRGEDSIAALCRREGIAESLYYAWSKRSSSKPASAAWQATRHERRRPTRSRSCVRKL